MKKYKFRGVLTIILACITPQAYCAGVSLAGDGDAEWDYSVPYLEKCAGSQIYENQCALDEFKSADNELNKLYDRLANELVDSDKFKASQLAWIKFRDLECTFRTSGVSDSGSLKPLLLWLCELDLTLKRVKDFQHLLRSRTNIDPTRRIN